MLRSIWRACSRLNIFISYAREDKGLAAELAQTLRNRGDAVFFDEDSLPPASDFNERIHAGIAASDRFIFLLSAHSRSATSYAQTELVLAKKKWPVPTGRVWPVSIDPELKLVDLDAYLRSVNVLVADGNIPARLAAEIDSSRTLKTRCRVLLGAAGLAASMAMVWLGSQVLGTTGADPIQVGMPVMVGHYTGAASLRVRLSASNTTGANLQVEDFRASLRGPDGKRTDLDPEGMSNGGIVSPLPQLLLQPGQSMVIDYAFNARPAVLIDFHMELFQRLSKSGMNVMNWDPNVEVVPVDLYDKLMKAANDNFIWTPGAWIAEIKFSVNGERRSSQLTFDISETDVEIMRSVFSQYRSGLGVLPGWRFVGAAGNGYRMVDAQPVAASDEGARN